MTANRSVRMWVKDMGHDVMKTAHYRSFQTRPPILLLLLLLIHLSSSLAVDRFSFTNAALVRDDNSVELR